MLLANRKSWLWRAVLVLPLAATLGGCKDEAKVEQEIVRPVKVAVIGEAVRGRALTYSGVVRPRIESAIGFRVAGKIIERFVNVGDRVEAGQVIARLDDADLQLAANSAKAAVASARSRRAVVSDNLERGRPSCQRRSFPRRLTTPDTTSWMRPHRRSTRRRRNCARLPMQ
jgi:multidrug efflux pump subunit AcrA (membrane-fusion protein)